MRLGVERALSSLRAALDEHIVIDGSVNYVEEKYTNVECVIKADESIPLVSAASIYGKVSRDAYMHKLGVKHQGYGLEGHVGYGTKAHLLAMTKLGPLKEIHRFSFKPISQSPELSL
jgi:ribonuclease HII